MSLRWATRAGVFDAEARPIGLRFERPLEGMHVVGASARGNGIDVLWYEFAGTKGKNAGPYGGARLVFGTIGPDDHLDPATRKIVLEGPLEFGSIEGHHRPRLVTTEAESMVVDIDKDRKCEAHRLGAQASTIHPSMAVCLIDPARLSGVDPLAQAETDRYARIFDDGPRRVAGQTGHDVGLVAWAGERAYYLGDSARALRSVARSDAEVRDEPYPFTAARSRIAWGALEADGEGLAFAGGKLRFVGPSGAVQTLGGDIASAVVALPELPSIDRRRVARIGKSWWIARGDVVRLVPESASAPLAGRGHPDTTALVGGASRGLLLDLDGPRLTATPFDESGPIADAPRVAMASPIRAGFDAATRAAGGSLVAGVAATSGTAPAPVVAFRIDAEGNAGDVKATSLHADGLAVRLVALPGGGAILSDRARTQVVWLDDDAREIASAAWPDEASNAACLDGSPARVMVPTPLPGRFVHVADLAAPGTCTVGDPTWGADGMLRWFGSNVHGLDARAEVGAVHVDGGVAIPTVAPRAATPASSDPPRAIPTPACPGEMVSIAEQFCVDRFESELVDSATGIPLAPDFSPSLGAQEMALGEWVTGRELVGDVHARAFPLPPLALWQRTGKIEPRAVSRMGVRPSGYVSGNTAASACEAAGKRLCSRTEFVTACRGDSDETFPYGDDFEDGACNVFRDGHPAAILHGNASIGHLDPRLNRVSDKDGPMLRETGSSPRCRSRWGADAVYDMVGNLDEWVDDPSGFAGGFYSRATRSGCDAMVSTHPPQYLDYSLGVRCCKDAAH